MTATVRVALTGRVHWLCQAVLAEFMVPVTGSPVTVTVLILPWLEVTVMPWAGSTSWLPSAGLIVMPVDGVFDAVGFALAVLFGPLFEPPAAEVPAWQPAASSPTTQTAATVSSGARLDDLPVLPVPSTLPSSGLDSTRRLPRPFPSMPDQVDLLGRVADRDSDHGGPDGMQSRDHCVTDCDPRRGADPNPHPDRVNFPLA